jgi:ParB-like chromosome segregation protein Spo0J
MTDLSRRLKACERLGWDFIPCIFLDEDTAIDREMWGIDENLSRAELTPAEEADHLKRRKEL